MTEFVWYASYGSNVNYDRFMCYIKGGKPKGSDTKYKGCTNKDEPLKVETIDIHHELYFSKTSDTWQGKGVAFIKAKNDEEVKTLGLMYLITKEQFIEVIQQENLKHYKNKKPVIDFDQLIREKTVSLDPLWYGRVMYIGEEQYPIITFSAKWEDSSIDPNMPSKEYLSTISQGLAKRHSMSKEDIVNYFIDKIGIKGKMTKDELFDYIDLS